MKVSSSPPAICHQPLSLRRDHLDALLSALIAQGYTPVGPTVEHGALSFGPISTTADLPVGWSDQQGPGSFKLVPRADEALFAYTVGPQSFKRYVYPPRMELWRAKRTERGFHLVPSEDAPPARYALVGMRACDLAALERFDGVMQQAVAAEASYAARRAHIFVIAAQCTGAGPLCFCSSMGTGPEVRAGFDISLTELLPEFGGHGPIEYVAKAASRAGEELLARLDAPAASAAQLERASAGASQAAAHMGRALNAESVRAALPRNPEHPAWSELESRCLSCANCTMVCPTCFCSTTVDQISLDGNEASRARQWDSCFTADFSAVHGGAVRPKVASRYRHWITHKLSTWYDQFGTSGCVGCGRCIAWCPVGIDITAEANRVAINSPPGQGRQEEGP